ncbi:MAG TPA: OsmC family protein [Propionicimonas sp.]
MTEGFSVVCASGTFRTGRDRATHFTHRWTDGGVDVVAAFTGAHLLHAAVAACVLNDLYREAASLGVQLEGVRVEAEGGFDATWVSTGVVYRVELDSAADRASQQALLDSVDRLAEIPRALRKGTTVVRVT